MKTLYIYDVTDHTSEDAVRNSSVQIIPPHSLLVVIRGMILAHSFPVALTTREVTIHQDMKALQIVEPSVAEYVLLACRAMKPEILKQVARSSHGTCRLDSQDVEGFTIPVPPLEEQKRIVVKVDQLMKLCDELEAKLKQTQTLSSDLMASTVIHLFSTTKGVSEVQLGYSNGKRDRKFVYGKTRKEVADKLADILNNQKQGLPFIAEKQTVKQFLTDWLENSVKVTTRLSTYSSPR